MSTHPTPSPRRGPSLTFSSKLVAATLILFGIAGTSAAATLTTKSSCTCTPTLTKTCSAYTTTTAANCTTYTSGTTSVSSTGKTVLSGLSLVCNLSDVPIAATPDNGDFPPTKNLVIDSDEDDIVTCRELNLDGTQAQQDGTTDLVGTFKLTQQTPLTDCLTVSSVGTNTVWSCALPAVATTEPLPRLPLWTLTPIGDDAALFCRADPTSSSSAVIPYNDPVPSNNRCYAKLGAPDNSAGNFPARDIGGGNLLQAGEVLTFSKPDGVLKFGPCHSGSFDGNDPISCADVPTGVFDTSGNEIVISTRSKAKFEGRLNIAVNNSPDSLNLKNSSKTATFPVIFYGAPGVDVHDIAVTQGSIVLTVGDDGTPQPVTIKNYYYVYATNPDGSAGDLELDLKVDFLRGDIKQQRTFIYAVTHPKGTSTPFTNCPITGSTTVDLAYAGTIGVVGKWVAGEVGENDLTLFNCPK